MWAENFEQDKWMTVPVHQLYFNETNNWPERNEITTKDSLFRLLSFILASFQHIYFVIHFIHWLYLFVCRSRQTVVFSGFLIFTDFSFSMLYECVLYLALPVYINFHRSAKQNQFDKDVDKTIPEHTTAVVVRRGMRGMSSMGKPVNVRPVSEANSIFLSNSVSGASVSSPVQQQVNEFMCTCATGWTGPTCEISKYSTRWDPNFFFGAWLFFFFVLLLCVLQWFQLVPVTRHSNRESKLSFPFCLDVMECVYNRLKFI